MFTGIIENIASIVGVEKDNSNIHFDIETPLAPRLKLIKVFHMMVAA
jgi:riboflavin synthase alpha subunit